jgi:Domain of unknown function (DUF4331)
LPLISTGEPTKLRRRHATGAHFISNPSGHGKTGGVSIQAGWFSVGTKSSIDFRFFLHLQPPHAHQHQPAKVTMKSHCLLLPPALLLAGILAVTARASSHREAPLISADPFHDATDFYAFRSYEEGRGDFITILANYYPLQDGYGGPNYS